MRKAKVIKNDGIKIIIKLYYRGGGYTEKLIMLSPGKTTSISLAAQLE